MAKPQQEEREPTEGHYVHCDQCGVGRFFEGRRISPEAENWATVHSLLHRRQR